VTRLQKIEMYYDDPAAFGARIQQLLERHGRCTITKMGDGVLVRVPKAVLPPERPSALAEDWF
jgi:hypothetical protein